MNRCAAVVFLLGVILSSACQAEPMDSPEPAQAVMLAFMNDLHAGRYEQAAAHYWPDYDAILISMNPDLNPDDLPALLRRGCEQNGFTCMLVEQVLQVETTPADDFLFTVTFTNENGERFVLGPCCGEDEDRPPIEEFEIRVSCSTGVCMVLDLPPYVP
ncbi:MAG: hypothetical protein JXA97_10880 [Anaerolineales bacterium]|nr:hypothetical protein [Anaerolineales bacterium]